MKPPIPAIVDAEVFERVREKRESRAPNVTPPRRVSSPTLLTGLLKCGVCGHGMTLVTGKSGKYKYYKCTSRHGQGNHACSSGNLPMEKLDELVLAKLANQVFTPERLQVIMEELRMHVQSSKNGQQEKVNELNRQLKNIEDRQQQLLDAIETSIVDLDETTQRRVQR